MDGSTGETPARNDLDPSFDIVGRGMAQWRHERPDIDCSGKAIVGRILRLQDVILRGVNSALERHGLRYPSYAVLATLRASGAPYRMSPSRLKETLLLTSGGTSNLLSRLESIGWIRRLADPRDGRGVIVELTDSGRELADRAMRDHAAMERALVAMFTEEEQTQLAAMLSRMLVLNGAPTAALQPPAAADAPRIEEVSVRGA
ncbi:MarR family transcriptional regulator [Microbaculum marinum]|uniref:MarR family transcriptional regulator n=1 Tax=Microbaculum marinum TaxID=1764581 RepID=A0AAW9RIW3_9HYPH